MVLWFLQKLIVTLLFCHRPFLTNNILVYSGLIYICIYLGNYTLQSEGILEVKVAITFHRITENELINFGIQWDNLPKGISPQIWGVSLK